MSSAAAAAAKSVPDGYRPEDFHCSWNPITVMIASHGILCHARLTDRAKLLAILMLANFQCLDQRPEPPDELPFDPNENLGITNDEYIEARDQIVEYGIMTEANMRIAEGGSRG